MTIPKIDPFRSPLGELLEQAQVERGLSAREASLMCGVSHTSFLNWKGGTIPAIGNIPAISAFCKEPASVILAAIGLDVDETYGFGDIPGYSHPLPDNASAVPRLLLAA